MSDERASVQAEVDVVVVGAGFAGMYLLHRMRNEGFSCVVLESADDVGGTWYWNRYPGARCDIPTVDYSYSFDPELEQEWTWSEKYATQPEIFAYAQHVADKYDLRRDIRFGTRVDAATWDDDAHRWHVRTEAGDELTCRWYVMATGCLSLPKTPDINGAERFQGEVYYTSRWPHEGVDFTGKRVAVIGTGSSGIQSIPLIAKQASQLTVFQRTPNFSVPAHNGPMPEDTLAEFAADRDAYREGAKWSKGGIPGEPTEHSALLVDDETRQQRLDAAWNRGELFEIIGVFNDVLVNPDANEVVAEYIRGKIREIVEDPETAEALCPKDHPFATKRPCLDTGYYATFNLPHVRLIDIRKHPIDTVTETGIDTVDESMEFDAIVYATGFDAMTGALVSVDIRGRGGVTLEQKWADGPVTYLGLSSAGFPNLFMVTGPGSPSVLSNMMVSIEQHVDWITDALVRNRTEGIEVMEPTPTAEAGWVQHVNDYADITLYPTANSWYIGANVPGKPRVFLPYVGGVDRYRQVCTDVAEQDYLGFRLAGPGGERCNDGVICRVQPDVAILLETMAELGAPAIEDLSVEDARAFMTMSAAGFPPGPEVGEIVDGVLPGADGSDRRYRLYRPDTPGPHPVTAYFHGGGWVLGSQESDDPFCRFLCVRSDTVVVSVDYRHAPEDRFPAAAEDGFAAVQWIADHAIELGGIPGELAVCGWSAGANVAAVAAQMARDAGGPDLSAQVLVNPVTDSDLSRSSYEENAEGYMLTRRLMEWFWNHYADPGDRTDPRAAPIRGDLHGLPPALVVTCELDPLRDEGQAYVEALQAAGVPAQHVFGRGQMHTSVTSVDIIVSANDLRDEIGRELGRLVRERAEVSA